MCSPLCLSEQDPRSYELFPVLLHHALGAVPPWWYRVRERGYESLTAFAEARPTASLVELAEELGPDDVAGVQVFSGLVAEAERNNQVTRPVRAQPLPPGTQVGA
jgi:hypothetical protein